MLSRIAESLFWIGRYAERADSTARMLQVHLRLQVEDPWVVEADAARSLLTLLGIDPVECGPEPSAADLNRLLGYDLTSPASIVSCWAAARDNARRAREVIPAELWECINTTWHQLPSGRFRPGRSNTFLEWTRERSGLFTGIARSTMVRDEGWQFLLLGRSLEQADMTSRLVSAASLSGTTPWPAVLRGCGAHDAFLRTYRGFRADREAAEFLILDSRFPKSVMHGLNRAIESLTKITQTHHGGSRETTEALRQLGRIRAHLEYTPLEDLMESLNHEMAAVQSACDLATRAITRSFFAVQDPTAWTTEEVS